MVVPEQGSGQWMVRQWHCSFAGIVAVVEVVIFVVGEIDGQNALYFVDDVLAMLAIDRYNVDVDVYGNWMMIPRTDHDAHCCHYRYLHL